MGREVRRVPANWEHPKNGEGHLIPLYARFPYNEDEIAEGLRDGWLENNPPHFGLAIMPQWTEDLRTHYQMYENVTEGTPISPVCATPEELAQWLAVNQASAGPYATATYEQWLIMITSGDASPSFAIVGEKIISGVEYEASLRRTS